MYFSKVIVKGRVDLIDIMNGSVNRLRLGEHNLIRVIHKDREYHVVKGSNNGSITPYWEKMEMKGKVVLTRMSDFDCDIRLDGIKLPIESPIVFNEFQKTHMVVGHLVKGKFLCNKCTLEKNLTHPDAIAVYPINIMPYSQGCFQCGLLVFNIWQRKKGGPLFLFD